MKFRKRMKPVIKKFNGLNYEAVDWYHSENSAIKKSNEYKNRGFESVVNLEEWWKGYFVYINGLLI
jgi:hypothetical protein